MDVYNSDGISEDNKLLYITLNQLLEKYKQYLEDKEHKEAYIKKQLDFISFFGIHYLIGYSGQSILEVDEYDVYDFLGSWCVRKVMYHDKTAIIPYLRALKKFFNFLFHFKKISEETHEALMAECHNPRKYIKKYERHVDLDPESETFEDDFEAWLYDEDVKTRDDLREELNLLLNSEKEFINNLPEDLTNKTSIVEDFKTFGNYISSFKNGIGLTQNLFCLKRNDILKLNSMMNIHEELDKNINQKDTILIHFFFLASNRLGLFKYTKKMNFIPTSLYQDLFLKKTMKEQYWILFRALWDKINWYRLNAYSFSGRPEWSFKERYSYPLFFTSLEVDEWISYREFLHLCDDYYHNQTLYPFSTRGLYLFGVFLYKIFPLFDYFGLFKLNFKNTKDSHSKELKLKIRPLGYFIFSNLSMLDKNIE